MTRGFGGCMSQGVDQGFGGCTYKVLDQGVQRMSGRPNAGRSPPALPASRPLTTPAPRTPGTTDGPSRRCGTPPARPHPGVRSPPVSPLPPIRPSPHICAYLILALPPGVLLHSGSVSASDYGEPHPPIPRIPSPLSAHHSPLSSEEPVNQGFRRCGVDCRAYGLPGRVGAGLLTALAAYFRGGGALPVAIVETSILRRRRGYRIKHQTQFLFFPHLRRQSVVLVGRRLVQRALCTLGIHSGFSTIHASAKSSNTAFQSSASACWSAPAGGGEVSRRPFRGRRAGRTDRKFGRCLSRRHWGQTIG